MFNPRNKPLSEMSEFEKQLRTHWVRPNIHDLWRVEQVWRDIERLLAQRRALRGW